MRARDIAAYAVAGLLVLATVPIYRYIIGHARADVAREEAAHVLPQPVEQMTTMRQPPPIPLATSMALEEPPAGIRCYGDAAVSIKGSVYTQAVGTDGRPLRCVAGKVLVPAH